MAKLGEINGVVMKAKVSVYITTQNRPCYLDRCLNSLRNQTYDDFEVLVCDDASEKCFEKEYDEVISKYKDVFKRLFYIKNDEVKGACYSRNLLIKKSEGVYITGLDDDDIFHKDRLKEFIDFNHIGDYSFICSSVSTVGEYNDFHNGSSKRQSKGFEIGIDIMKGYNVVGNQIFIERSKLISVGGFDNEMPAWQDYDTWFRLIKKYGPAFKLGAITMFLDDSQDRKRITTSSRAYDGYLMFVNKHKEDLTNKNLISLKYVDMINRKESFNPIKLELLKEPGLFLRVFKYRAVYQYPIIYTFYSKFIR